MLCQFKKRQLPNNDSDVEAGVYTTVDLYNFNLVPVVWLSASPIRYAFQDEDDQDCRAKPLL